VWRTFSSHRKARRTTSSTKTILVISPFSAHESNTASYSSACLLFESPPHPWRKCSNPSLVRIDASVYPPEDAQK
jgi:hypothetical protein